MRALNHNEPVRANGEDGIACLLGDHGPVAVVACGITPRCPLANAVSGRCVAVRAGRGDAGGKLPANFVAQINANHQRLVFIAPSHRFPIADEGCFWVLGGVPKPVTVGRVAAPVASTAVVVENSHEALCRQCVDDRIQDLKGGLSPKLGVGRDGAVGYDRILFNHLVAERNAHRIEPHAANLLGNRGHRLNGESVGNKRCRFGTVPVHARQLESLAVGVDDVTGLRAQGNLRHCYRRARRIDCAILYEAFALIHAYGRKHRERGDEGSCPNMTERWVPLYAPCLAECMAARNGGVTHSYGRSDCHAHSVCARFS
jgi:hypothetical protein